MAKIGLPLAAAGGSSYAGRSVWRPVTWACSPWPRYRSAVGCGFRRSAAASRRRRWPAAIPALRCAGRQPDGRPARWDPATKVKNANAGAGHPRPQGTPSGSRRTATHMTPPAARRPRSGHRAGIQDRRPAPSRLITRDAMPVAHHQREVTRVQIPDRCPQRQPPPFRAQHVFPWQCTSHASDHAAALCAGRWGGIHDDSQALPAAGAPPAGRVPAACLCHIS